jgi:hypothetical protein
MAVKCGKEGSVSSAAQFSRLGDAQELVVGHETAENVAAVSVEKPGPPHVMV